MKYFASLGLAGSLLFNACSNPKQPASPAPDDSLSRAASGAARNAFFPVAEYLEAEILHVDSSLLALHKFTTRNGHTDSAFIQLAEFNQLALQFVPAELADSSFEKNFTETAFQDKATQSITFTYSTANKDMGLQRVDVTTIPGLRAQQVKSIYLEKNRTAGDSLIVQKLFWRAHRSFEIATLVQVKGAPAGEQQVKVVWDRDHEDEE
jgi:hypothetical protein